MKRGTIEHPKMIMLSSMLGLDIATTVGILECLWHWTAKYAPAGDIGRYSDEAIARGCYAPVDGALLVRSASACGWIDEHHVHRYVVHDWHEHADDTTHKALARKLKFFANGAKPNTRRLPAKERERIEKAYVAMIKENESAPNAHSKRSESALRAPSLSLSLSLSPSLDSIPPKPPKGGGVVELPESLRVEPLVTEFAKWVEYLRPRGKTLEQHLERIAELGPERAAAALHYSRTNGYKGIVEQTQQKKSGSHLRPEERRDATPKPTTCSKCGSANTEDNPLSGGMCYDCTDRERWGNGPRMCDGCGEPVTMANWGVRMMNGLLYCASCEPQDSVKNLQRGTATAKTQVEACQDTG